jgi:hypothetical protein
MRSGAARRAPTCSCASAPDNYPPEQFGPGRRRHHHGPAGLAVADHARLSVGARMERDRFLQEHRFGAHDVFDRVSPHRVGMKPTK